MKMFTYLNNDALNIRNPRGVNKFNCNPGCGAVKAKAIERHFHSPCLY